MRATAHYLKSQVKAGTSNSTCTLSARSESDNKICPKGISLSLIIPFLLLTAKPEQNQGLSESAHGLETKTFHYHCIIWERHRILTNGQMTLQIHRSY